MRLKYAFVFSLVSILSAGARADTVSVFSTGYGLPETITAVPSGFGSASGNYFVVDDTRGLLDVAPVGGGPAKAFKTIPVGAYSGTFVPAGYGTLTGTYLVTGNGVAVTVASNGAVTGHSFSATTDGAIVAPASFGAYAGKVLLGNIEPSGAVDILVLNSNGSTTKLVTLSGVGQPFGLSFASSGFGSVGGDLLVTDGSSGRVYAISSTGTVSLFATLPVPAGGSIGLRQLATAPAGFGNFGGDLFVSVSGSQAGGGSLGEVDILNGSGAIIGNLLQGTVGSPFDPRGLTFTSGGDLLVADAKSGNILEVTPAGFTAPTPEPSGIVLLATGMLGAAAFLRRKAALGC